MQWEGMRCENSNALKGSTVQRKRYWIKFRLMFLTSSSLGFLNQYM